MKRIVSIQDISCIGKCSQTIALPVLSAMGIETSIIPTAILSAHTMFPDFTFRDLSEDIPKIKNHWLSQGVTFDGILTGYLGSVKQIEMISGIYKDFGTEKNLIVLDPVFADKGRIYPGFDMEYAKAIASLCSQADYIVPNITEAAYITGIPYREVCDMAYIETIFDVLTQMGVKNTIITSVHIGDENGIVCRLANNRRFSVFRSNIDAPFHGTGDLFASTFTGALLNGLSTEDAAELAVDYVTETLCATLKNNKHNWYGVDFEATLPYLMDRLYAYRNSY